MRKIEFLENVSHDGALRRQGEIRVEEDAEAGYFIACGWAKDVETGETGERKPGMNVEIVPDSIRQKLAGK